MDLILLTLLFAAAFAAIGMFIREHLSRSPQRRPPPPGGLAPVAPDPALSPQARTEQKSDLPTKVGFIDVETTGLRSYDRVITCAVISLTTAALAEAQLDIAYSYVICDPGRKSHPEAEAIHGYSDWLLRHQDTFESVAVDIHALLDACDMIVAHNAEFDLEFINREFAAAGLSALAKPVYCTMQVYLRANAGSARLDVVAGRLGLSRQGTRHGALEDAWLAMMIFLRQNGLSLKADFSSITNPSPINLKAVPAQPDGPLPRRKRRPKSAVPASVSN